MNADFDYGNRSRKTSEAIRLLSTSADVNFGLGRNGSIISLGTVFSRVQMLKWGMPDAHRTNSRFEYWIIKLRTVHDVVRGRCHYDGAARQGTNLFIDFM